MTFLSCLSDMAPPSLASPALRAMQEIQTECFKLGIPLRTRHRGELIVDHAESE